MIFSSLAPLLEDVDVSLQMSRLDTGEIKVIVAPKRADKNQPDVLFTQLQLTATAEELDAEFVNAVANYRETRKSISDQLSDQLSSMKDKAASKPAAGKSGAKEAASAGKPGKKPAKEAETNSDNLPLIKSDADITTADYFSSASRPERLTLCKGLLPRELAPEVSNAKKDDMAEFLATGFKKAFDPSSDLDDGYRKKLLAYAQEVGKTPATTSADSPEDQGNGEEAPAPNVTQMGATALNTSPTALD